MKVYPRRDPEVVNKVLTLLTTTRLTGGEVAEKVGISYNTLQRITNDLKLNLNERRGVYELPPDQMWALIYDYLETTELGTDEISEKLGITAGRQQQLAFRNNYSLRKRNMRIKRGDKCFAERATAERTEPPPKLDINKLWKPRR